MRHPGRPPCLPVPPTAQVEGVMMATGYYGHWALWPLGIMAAGYYGHWISWPLGIMVTGHYGHWALWSLGIMATGHYGHWALWPLGIIVADCVTTVVKETQHVIVMATGHWLACAVDIGKHVPTGYYDQYPLTIISSSY